MPVFQATASDSIKSGYIMNNITCNTTNAITHHTDASALSTHLPSANLTDTPDVVWSSSHTQDASDVQHLPSANLPRAMYAESHLTSYRTECMKIMTLCLLQTAITSQLLEYVYRAP